MGKLQGPALAGTILGVGVVLTAAVLVYGSLTDADSAAADQTGADATSVSGSVSGSAGPTSLGLRSNARSEPDTGYCVAAEADRGTTPTDVTGTFAVDDLDGDGEPDQLWVSPTRKGITFSAGGMTTQKLSSPASQSVSVFVARLGNGARLIVEEGADQAYLSALVDCRLRISRNIQGEQYGFVTTGHQPNQGYGCRTVGGQRVLVGYELFSSMNPDRPWVIQYTTVLARDGGTRIVNGPVTFPDVRFSRAEGRARLARITGAETCGHPPVVTTRTTA